MKRYYFFAIISIFVFNSCKKQVTEPVNKQLKLLFPNGGETLMVDSTYNIQWKSQNVDKLNITYSIDNGAKWNTLGRNVDASAGHFSWIIPDSVSKAGCIKISSIDSSVQDESDNNFNIDVEYHLKLLFPNGGEKLYADSTYDIKWQSKNVDSINIFYSINSGTTWQILAKDIKASKEHYAWTVSENNTDHGLIKILTPDDSYQDKSDNIFTITKNYVLKLLFPNGGETLYIDSTYNIKWQSENMDKLNITYSVDNGTNWKTLAQNINASKNFYSWRIPFAPTNKGLIKISQQNISVEDISDDNFTIKYTPGYMQDVSKYYPLKVGDFWVYNFTWIPLYDPSVSYLIKKEIIDKNISNGETYYRVKITPIINDSDQIDSNTFIYKSDNWQRIDTSNGWIKIKGYSGHGDIPWINIALKDGQTITGGSGTGSYKIEVLSEEENQVLGISTKVKKYKKVDAFQSYLYDLAKNIGLIKYRLNGDGNISYVYTLKGAKLDNVIIGDTTTTE